MKLNYLNYSIARNFIVIVLFEKKSSVIKNEVFKIIILFLYFYILNYFYTMLS